MAPFLFIKTHIRWEKEEKWKERRKERRKNPMCKKKELESEWERRLGMVTALLVTLRST